MKPPQIANYNPLARVPADETPRLKAWEEACRIAEWIRCRHQDAKVLAFGSSIELPSPFPMREGPPEIFEIPKRLESSLRRAGAWLREIQKSADLSAREPEAERTHLLLDAAR